MEFYKLSSWTKKMMTDKEAAGAQIEETLGRNALKLQAV